MVEVIFPDGSTLKARTWRGLLAAWRAEQWHKWTPIVWRFVLQKRCLIYTGEKIPVVGTSAEFGRSLANAGMFRVVEDKPE